MFLCFGSMAPSCFLEDWNVFLLQHKWGKDIHQNGNWMKRRLKMSFGTVFFFHKCLVWVSILNFRGVMQYQSNNLSRNDVRTFGGDFGIDINPTIGIFQHNQRIKMTVFLYYLVEFAQNMTRFMRTFRLPLKGYPVHKTMTSN